MDYSDTPASSLSAGSLLREALMAAPAVAARVTDIFPVVADEATLPYVYYRRKSLGGGSVKSYPTNDTVVMELVACAATYDGAVELAEAIRAALDGRSFENDTLQCRSCTLVDAAEHYEADAFVQVLSLAMRCAPTTPRKPFENNR